jgi:hypothetical protein
MTESVFDSFFSIAVEDINGPEVVWEDFNDNFWLSGFF